MHQPILTDDRLWNSTDPPSLVIIVDFYIDDFIFALFIFMKDGKAVNYNGSEIIGLINLKYGKRTACRDNIFTENAVFSREAGKRSTTGYKS